MKSSTKSSIRNILVSLVLLGSAAYFGWMFTSELFRTIDNVGGTVVGEVVEVRGQAQRRYDRQSRWLSLKGAEEVYNMDAIRTSEESGAVIVLKTLDETGVEQVDEISLGPDTYIILDLFGDSRNINFVGGAISARGADGLTVMAEGTTVEVDQGAVNLERVEGLETSVTVTEGEARVNSGGEETLVGTESVLRIDESDGSTREERALLRPLSPGSNALLLTYNDQRRVDFAWELFANWSQPLLEVSANSTFDDAEAEVLRTSAAASASLELEPKLWYWRVRDSQSNSVGPVNVFTVETERPIVLLSPAAELEIPFRGDAPAVSLQWSRAWFAESYDVEVSRNASFAQIAAARDATGGSVLMENLDEGIWWWRVVPRYRRGELDTAPVVDSRSFVLERRTGHDAPLLINPPAGASISALEVREGVDFRWQGEEGMVDYRIEVAADEDFANVLALSDAPENWRNLLTAPAPDTYFWRVSATAADGQPVPQSEVRSFEILPFTGSVELIDPAPGEIKEIEPYAPYTFLWRSGLEGTARFLLERINDSISDERTKIIESMVNGESFTAPLPGEGSYVWRVQVLDQGGRLLVESPEARFRLRSEFGAPILNTPRPGSGIDLVGSTTIALAWDPAPGADAYRVVLRAPDDSVIGRDDRVNTLEREFPVPAGAVPGSYSVELASIRNNPPPGASGNSESSIYRFNVDSLIRYTAAEPLSPVNGDRIDALNAINNGVVLRWSQDPPLGRWTVELDNGRITRLYRTTETFLILEGLEAGSYSWLVRSNDGFGQQAPDSRISQFSVSDLPTPRSPSVSSPGPGENLDMTGQSSITFAWSAVEDADFYDLALYVEGSEVPLFRKNGLRGTRFVLENLSILDVGNFAVSVTARAEYAGVGIVRESDERRVPFSLSLNIADKPPTILTDELQYAD